MDACARARQHTQTVDITVRLCLFYSKSNSTDMSSKKRNEYSFFFIFYSDFLCGECACVCVSEWVWDSSTAITSPTKGDLCFLLLLWFFFLHSNFIIIMNMSVGRRRSTPKITQLELVLSLSNFCYCCCCRFSLYSTIFGIRTRRCCGSCCYYFVLFTRTRTPYILACLDAVFFFRFLVCWQSNRTN